MEYELITIEINGELKTGDKNTLLRYLKHPNFWEMTFETDIYYAGVYVTTAHVQIQKGDRYCSPQNINKIYTFVNKEGDKVGLRPAQKAIRDAIIKNATVSTY